MSTATPLLSLALLSLAQAAQAASFAPRDPAGTAGRQQTPGPSKVMIRVPGKGRRTIVRAKRQARTLATGLAPVTERILSLALALPLPRAMAPTGLVLATLPSGAGPSAWVYAYAPL